MFEVLHGAGSKVASHTSCRIAFMQAGAVKLMNVDTDTPSGHSTTAPHSPTLLPLSHSIAYGLLNAPPLLLYHRRAW
jgi:hypothetical protein